MLEELDLLPVKGNDPDLARGDTGEKEGAGDLISEDEKGQRGVRKDDE